MGGEFGANLGLIALNPCGKIIGQSGVTIWGVLGGNRGWNWGGAIVAQLGGNYLESVRQNHRP